MPALPFFTECYSKPGFRLPSARLINMYCEETPAGPGPVACFPRPTLKLLRTLGAGPVKGMFRKDNVAGGNIYAVSGDGFYKDGTLISAVASGPRARFAGSAQYLALVIGGLFYTYDGATFQRVRYFKEYGTSLLTITGLPIAGQTVTIGAKTYTWRAAVGVTANEVKIGATTAEALANLTAAANLGTGSGTVYGSSTTINTAAGASGATATTLLFTAKAYDPAGSMPIATTETMANGSFNRAVLGDVTELPAFSGICYTGNRFYLSVAGADQFYWTDPAKILIDGLSFATAETAPDPIVDIASTGDEVWLIGSETVEPWYQTGNADLPVQKSQGRRYEKGSAAQGTVVALDNTIFFVGNDHLVYRSSTVPERISTHAIEGLIDLCADITTATAYPVWFGGHAFYVLNIPGVGTRAFDVSRGEWSEWTSYGRDTFAPVCSVIVDNTIYLGSGVDGKVYTFERASQMDDGQPVTFLASAFLPLKAGKVSLSALMLQATRGLGSATGLTRPVVEMRYSDDTGQTWSGWRQASLGKMGQYKLKARWARLGQMQSPGRGFEFRTTDAVPVAYEFATFNEAVA